MNFRLLTEKAAEQGEPWKTLIGQFCTFVQTDRVEVHHVDGPHPGNEQATLEAICIVGVVPGNHVPAEWHCIWCTDPDPPTLIARLKDAAQKVRAAQPLLEIPLPTATGMLAGRLGKDATHFVGALSVCRTTQTQEWYTALWVPHTLNDEVVGTIVRRVVAERL